MQGFNPLLDSLDSLSDVEIDNKIFELNKKFWQTHNPQVRGQISVLLDQFKLEAEARRARQRLKNQEQNGDNSLDNLINIS
jgi:hypothetical protein